MTLHEEPNLREIIGAKNPVIFGISLVYLCNNGLLVT